MEARFHLEVSQRSDVMDSFGPGRTDAGNFSRLPWTMRWGATYFLSLVWLFPLFVELIVLFSVHCFSSPQISLRCEAR